VNIKSSSEHNFFSVLIFDFVVVGALVYLWPSLIAPFGFFEPLTIKGSLFEAVCNAWPVYLFAISINVVMLPSVVNSLGVPILWRSCLEGPSSV